MIKLFGILLCASFALGHDEYRGKCPKFTPMNGFDWSRFSNGIWYAVEKFDTTQSKCITYNFTEDAGGFKEIVQHSEITSLERLSVDNKFRYVGKLATPRSSNPADMIVRFQLNFFGSASFVVMDTDYENYALVCTCQAKKLIFDILTFHRRSCTILQRNNERDTTITNKLRDLVNEQMPVEDGQKADHDFDVVNHDFCNYKDDGKDLRIDIDSIIGDATDGDESIEDEDYDGSNNRGYIVEYDLIKDGLVELI